MASTCFGLPMQGDVVSFQNSAPHEGQRLSNACSYLGQCPSSCSPNRRYSPSGASTDSDSSLHQQLHTIEGVHAVFGSPLFRGHTAPHVPNQKVLAAVAGTGLAPWEIHRPQKFVRDLVLRRCFSGRVLDAGCGIGDNALYVAKACPGAQVTAVDRVPRCLDFASTKAVLRGIRGKITLLAADLCDYEGLPGELRAEPFDVVLDSFTFHGFPDEEREKYVGSLWRLLRPGGMVYMSCMSEEETRPGGARRITVAEAEGVFCREAGWQLEAVEESIIELHPTFWNGRSKARLYTIRRL